MRRLILFLLLGLLATQAYCKNADAHTVIVYGKAVQNGPGWAIVTQSPEGWTNDCCKFASAIGVNLVLYQGEWTGKPERVMVLNVWPAKLPTLDADVQEDRKHYLQSDAHGQADAFAVANPKAIACQGVLYRGSDQIDDVVVFCDPGKASGIRYSWSMTVSDTDPNRQALIGTFKRVVEQSLYMKYVSDQKPAHPAAAK
ncbi:hypothetical protein [Dyella flagellata]|uniref:START domain-containing protein n=1 Tax=Dyella flagellata TaxID=1867833 RepID=A0ABQ5XGA0_9GAMM|nr:hypothetical protein [Dyella flagellata]GLQ90577.1 hypothetical protein GCM10007898_41530 [Dyella flagellata]